ncbi:MAG TPA: hypothetical protein PLX06_08925, partial [Fimbriimonadaceae bacterium]|nr:hypothetical protein [Fimbriimonadaceae bacterium]
MNHAWRVLEFDAVREMLARHCQTTPGAELARALEPSFEAEAVWDLVEETQQAESFLGQASAPSLAPVTDLRQAFLRAEKGGVLGASELCECAWCLQALRQMRVALTPLKSELECLWG